MLVRRVRAGARVRGQQYNIIHRNEKKQLFLLCLHLSDKRTDISMGCGDLPIASYGHITFGFIQSFPKYKADRLRKE